MENKRTRLLRKKRQELKTALQRWAADNRILAVDEQLTVQLSITRLEPVVVRVADQNTQEGRKALLPQDDGGSTWMLTEKDWDKLAKLPFSDTEAAFLTLLRTYNNGPLHTTEIIAKGIPWDRGFLIRFNKVLKKAGNFLLGESYYHLYQVNRKDGYYAIVKGPGIVR